jgi:hypothetical protein
MLFAVEPFFLQDDRRHAVVEQREARVMSPGYDPENLHDDARGIDWVLRFLPVRLRAALPWHLASRWKQLTSPVTLLGKSVYHWNRKPGLRERCLFRASGSLELHRC